MLEADSLCNRIEIMAKGNLKTIGTQQWLKDKYGAGYLLQLNLASSDKETQDRAMAFVRERLHPDATLQSKQDVVRGTPSRRQSGQCLSGTL